MPTEKVRRKSETWIIAVLIPVVLAVLTIGGFIYAGGGDAEKARQAFKFVEKNVELPMRVANLEKAIADLRDVPKTLGEIKGQFKLIAQVMKTWTKDAKKIEKRVERIEEAMR